jgi:ornithine cyclodeaminase
MVGAGALAPYLIAAHASVRPIAEVFIWNRNPEKAERLAAHLNEGRNGTLSPLWGEGSPRSGLGEGLSSAASKTPHPSVGKADRHLLPQGEKVGARPPSVTAVADLESAVRQADVVSCATLSAEPLVKGAWLKPGAHLDLVGAYTPAMRECDDAAVRRARIFVDTRAGALNEAGDIVLPITAGIIGEGDIAGDLFDLCRAAIGGRAGRESDDEITLFKSVGSAIEDLAAAALAWKRMKPATYADEMP